jgi:uncharacterized protein
MQVHELDRDECLEILGRIPIGHLACARDGQPYIVPIHFSFDAEHSCLYAISPAGQKIDWMRENPKVCVEVEDIASQAQWSTVLVFGRYEEVSREPRDATTRSRVERLFEQRERWWFPAAARMGSRKLGEMIVYRVVIDRFTGRRTSTAGS